MSEQAAPMDAASPHGRLALRLHEAAAAIGVSVDFFDEHVRPEIRVIRRGRVMLVAVAELEKWLDRSAARLSEPRSRR